MAAGKWFSAARIEQNEIKLVVLDGMKYSGARFFGLQFLCKVVMVRANLVLSESHGDLLFLNCSCVPGCFLLAFIYVGRSFDGLGLIEPCCYDAGESYLHQLCYLT